MSKNPREARKSALADWQVATAAALGCPVAVHRARMERDQHGGYIFTDDKGTVADYPPGAVLSVTRAEPAEPKTEVHVHVDGKPDVSAEKAALAHARRNNTRQPAGEVMAGGDVRWAW